jgi:hypothetical protein
MFIPCIIRRIRKDQQYTLIFTTPLFYVLAPTHFGRRLPSSGSFLDFQPYATVYCMYFSTTLYIFSILYVLYHIQYIVHHVVITSFNLLYSTLYFIHIDFFLSAIYFRYTTHSICISTNLGGSKRPSDDDRLLPKHVGSNT